MQIGIKFFIFGLSGICLEVLWTGFASLMKGDRKLLGKTYLWMVPIYGFAGLLFEQIYFHIANLQWFFRGLIWTALIFFVEYTSGRLLKLTIGICPWDYSASRYSVDGFIRLDYAPAWFAAGLLFEKIYNIINNTAALVS